MNPMSDTLYRDFRANELSREIARERLISSALQTRPADLVGLIHSVRFSIQERFTMKSASARRMVRHFSTLARRPARS
jgi:hypothetical protein